MGIKKDSELMSISFEWEDIDNQDKDNYKIIYDIQNGQKVISFTNQSTSTNTTLPLSLLKETYEYLIEKNILSGKVSKTSPLVPYQNNIQKATLIKKKEVNGNSPVQSFSDYQEDISDNTTDNSTDNTVYNDASPKIKTNITKKENNKTASSVKYSHIPDPIVKVNKPINIIGSKKEPVTREESQIKVSDNISNTIRQNPGYTESDQGENRTYKIDNLSKNEAKRLIEKGYYINKSGDVVKDDIIDITLFRLLEQAGVDTD